MFGHGRKGLELLGNRVETLVEMEPVRPLLDEIFNGLVDGRTAHQDALARYFGQLHADMLVTPVEQAPVGTESGLLAQMRFCGSVGAHHFQPGVFRLQVLACDKTPTKPIDTLKPNV